MDAIAADTFFIRKHVTGDQTHQSVPTFNLWHYQVDSFSVRYTTHMIALYKTRFSNTFISHSLAAWNNSMEQSPSREVNSNSKKILLLILLLVRTNWIHFLEDSFTLYTSTVTNL
jgi:hypothetical protein